MGKYLKKKLKTYVPLTRTANLQMSQEILCVASEGDTGLRMGKYIPSN